MFAKRNITFILAALILAGGLLCLGYFLGSGEKETSQQEELEVYDFQTMEAGDVGEVLLEEEKTGIIAPLVSPTMPPAIFSTAGIIVELKPESVVIMGSGTNFADGFPRTLTAVITSDTIIFDKNQTFRWHGSAGLGQLKLGTEVLIGSPENIRGKTEFRAKTINIL